MKTLIEKSIKITGIPKPNPKTIFNLNEIPVLSEDSTQEEKVVIKNLEIENQKIMNDVGFVSLSIISGRKLVVEFEWGEDGVKTLGRTLIQIPKTDSEEEIKNLILNTIRDLE
jgi:hypothetical protein